MYPYLSHRNATEYCKTTAPVDGDIRPQSFSGLGGLEEKKLLILVARWLQSRKILRCLTRELT
jgi:hypothetical protein